MAFEDAKTFILKKGSVPGGSNSIAARFTIPESEYGVHFVQFMRNDGDDIVNMQFNVRSNLKIKPSSAESGTTVKVIGTGFPANDRGVVVFDDRATTVTVITNKVGSFTADFTIPDVDVGNHELIASTSQMYIGNTTATLKVLPASGDESSEDDNNAPDSEPDNDDDVVSEPAPDSHPPPSPMAVAPLGQKFGLFGSKQVTFNWTSVSDSSGITYTFEVADKVDFASIEPGLRQTGLTSTNRTISIAPGTYYWRVKAVDGAGNTSHWAYAPYAFQVGELSNLFRDFFNALKALVGMG